MGIGIPNGPRKQQRHHARHVWNNRRRYYRPRPNKQKIQKKNDLKVQYIVLGFLIIIGLLIGIQQYAAISIIMIIGGIWLMFHD